MPFPFGHVLKQVSVHLCSGSRYSFSTPARIATVTIALRSLSHRVVSKASPSRSLLQSPSRTLLQPSSNNRQIFSICIKRNSPVLFKTELSAATTTTTLTTFRCTSNHCSPFSSFKPHRHYSVWRHLNTPLTTITGIRTLSRNSSGSIPIAEQASFKQTVLVRCSNNLLIPYIHLQSSTRSFRSTSDNSKMPPVESENFDYDLIVIGGGSGGLAASKEAASLGKKVALLDFVSPTPRGTTWGIGGTCVNVGCIPKKLMHHASLVGQEIEDAHFFGWKTKEDKPLKDNLKHDWNTLVTYVQNNIKGSNFSYKALLNNSKVKYINAYGSFVGPHKLKIVHKNSKEEFLTAKDFIISTGERPRYPSDVEGAVKYSITSDDLFSLPYSPGKTLVIGASYVALECAGFLRGLGYDVSVMVRSIVLRGFDRQCSELVRSYMQDIEEVRFLDTSIPNKVEQLEEPKDGKPPLLRVTYTDVSKNEKHVEEFNTVIFAIGRNPCTDNIGLELAGVQKDKDGRIPVVNEQTNVKHVYAIGDILQGKPKLTPVAIEAGILLARRLYAGGDVQCDYQNVPTTVFTPLEYGCCGLTEEEAIEKHGADNIEVYHQYFSPTEWRLNYYDRPRKPMNVCYAKVITTRSLTNNPKEELLLGFHYVGPNAGEVTQFLGIPLKMKATKADLDALIGIHPTCAEILTTLCITKRSGKEATQQGCCG